MASAPRSAHALLRLARLASPDPFVDDVVASAEVVSWLYGPDQYELGTLERLVEEGFAANRFVHYATNYGRAMGRTRFRLALTGRAARLRLRSSDELDIAVDQQPVNAPLEQMGWLPIDFPAVSGFVELEGAAQRGPTTVGVPVEQAEGLARWQAWSEHDGWVSAESRLGGLVPPHLAGEPIQRLTAHRDRDGLYVVPAPALGHVTIQCSTEPVVRTGESAQEARAEGDSETRHDLLRGEDGHWRSRRQLGLRY